MEDKLFFTQTPSSWHSNHKYLNTKLFNETEHDQLMQIRRDTIRYLCEKNDEIRKIIRQIVCHSIKSNVQTDKEIIECILRGLRNFKWKLL